MKVRRSQAAIRVLAAATSIVALCDSLSARSTVTQVEVASKIVTISRKDVEAIGFDRKIGDVLAKLPTTASDLSPNTASSVGLTGQNVTVDGLFPNDEGRGLTLSGILTTEQVEAIIVAVERERRAKVISGPNIVIPSGKGATLDTSSIPGLRDYGLQINVNPRINLGGKVDLRLTPRLRGFDFTPQKISVGMGRVPMLGDIPVLGGLFESKAGRAEKRNLMIFVTPRLVDALSGGAYEEGDGAKVDIEGTNETSGIVANFKIQNMTDQPFDLYIPPLVLESINGSTQDYSCPNGKMVTIGSRQTETVPVEGVCVNRDKPPVGMNVAGQLAIHTLDPNVPKHPGCHLSDKNVSDLLRVSDSVYRAVDQILKDGALKNFPYKDKQEQENILVQWSMWTNPQVSEISKTPPATKDDMKKVVYKQAEPKASVAPETKKKIDKGIDAIFEKVELTSGKAKDLEQPDQSGSEVPTPAPQTQ